MKKCILIILACLLMCSCEPSTEEVDKLNERLQKLEEKIDYLEEESVKDSDKIQELESNNEAIENENLFYKQKVEDLEDSIEKLNGKVHEEPIKEVSYPIYITTHKEFLDTMEYLKELGTLYTVEVLNEKITIDEIDKDGIDVSISMSLLNFNTTINNGGNIRIMEEGIVELNRYEGNYTSGFFIGQHTYVCSKDKLEKTKVYAKNNPSIFVYEESSQYPKQDQPVIDPPQKDPIVLTLSDNLNPKIMVDFVASCKFKADIEINNQELTREEPLTVVWSVDGVAIKTLTTLSTVSDYFETELQHGRHIISIAINNKKFSDVKTTIIDTQSYLFE